MAEQEVIKHTKNVFSIWLSNKSFWHKLKDFLLEIFIIVFAISLSIYLHDRSEKKHERHETKEFLLGLREDLKTDLQEMNADKKAFEESKAAFTYIISIKLDQKVNEDSVDKHYNRLFNATGLVPNNGRFEGFKSSGKIGNIENVELQNNIMDLYQEDMPMVLLSSNAYGGRKRQFQDYVYHNKKRLTDSTNNLTELLKTDQAINFSTDLIYTGEIVERYDTCIKKIKLIIEEIDKEYGR